MAVLVPIAVPVPIWAYGLELPPMPTENAFDLENKTPPITERATNFMEMLLRGAFRSSTSKDDKGKEKKTKKVNIRLLESKVDAIETEIQDRIRVEKGKIISLAAVPLDSEKNPVNGLSAKWTTSNRKVIEILNETQAIARGEGGVKLTVRSGKIEKEIYINVFALKRNVRPGAMPSPTPVPLEPDLEESDASVLTMPENNLGRPAGQTEMGSRTRASATQTSERYGSANYSFNIPVASLPGRGLDAGVGITYNSRLWTKSMVSSNRVFNYNVDNNWLAPGFELGFGSIEGYSTSSPGYGYLLTAPDGTRTQLYHKSTSGSC